VLSVLFNQDLGTLSVARRDPMAFMIEAIQSGNLEVINEMIDYGDKLSSSSSSSLLSFLFIVCIHRRSSVG